MILRIGSLVLATRHTLDAAAGEFYRMGVKDGRAEYQGDPKAPSDLARTPSVSFFSYLSSWSGRGR